MRRYNIIPLSETCAAALIEAKLAGLEFTISISPSLGAESYFG
jgi:hypothetical protein